MQVDWTASQWIILNLEIFSVATYNDVWIALIFFRFKLLLIKLDVIGLNCSLKSYHLKQFLKTHRK